ncbi:polygalacturonase QRT3-like [Magnolia sinica]|uniref:polygalacturonase QRT3-like n=1 Tax=Magnolia sinica TaxID=86752 RepID=UPI00265A7113|nr:polygalacturonase QRT3-like [Magnolia sinica]
MGHLVSRCCLVWPLIMGVLSFIVIRAYGEDWREDRNIGDSNLDGTFRMEQIKARILLRSRISPSPAPSFTPTILPRSRVYHVTVYGADPTGKIDSTDAIMRAISDAFQAPDEDRVLMAGITDLGGAQVHLDGGIYKISRPLRMPASGGGNLMIHGGSLRASDDFPKDRHLIELWPFSSTKMDTANYIPMQEAVSAFSSSYEDIKLKDLMLDCSLRGGGILVINSLRTTIDNCYITRFTSDGIRVQGGHETYIRNSFLGQYITSGRHPNEKNFKGVAINLMGNDNAVTDVVIFSAEVGVLVSGQANVLTGVHCYNKATGWGGTGIYLRLPGLTQTRIVNCYMDYTGIVAEDPVQLHISGTFFLGDAFVTLKSVNGIARGVSIVDNMFAGGDKGTPIVKLDGSFTDIDQVEVDRNDVKGMVLKSTVARGSIEGNKTMWAIDFSRVLLFPNLIKYVQYTLQATASFPNHALRNSSMNRVVIESDVPVTATVHVYVQQTMGSIG